MARTKTTWPKGGTAKPPTRGPTGKHAQKNPTSYIEPTDAAMQPYIERFLCGDSLRDLAREIGISHEQVRRRMMKWALTGKADKTYADLVTDLLVDRIALADMALASAQTMSDITRADKVCRYARMDFERRRPHLYGQRAEITFSGPAAIFLGLPDAAQAPLTLPAACTQIAHAEAQAEADHAG